MKENEVEIHRILYAKMNIKSIILSDQWDLQLVKEAQETEKNGD